MTGTISTTGKHGRRVARARGMAIATVRKRCPWAVRVANRDGVILAIESYEDCPELAPVYDMRHIVVQGVEFKG